MKKTLLVTLEFPPFIGGVANHLSSLCGEMDPEKIVVLADEYEGSIEFDQKQSYKIIRKPFFTKLPIWPKWLFLFFKMKKIIRQEKIEALWIGQILPIGTVAMFFKLPFIVMTYAMDVTILSESPRRKRLATKIIAKAKKMITISTYTKNQLIRLGAKEEEIVMAYPCSTIKFTNLKDERVNEIKRKYNPENKKVILSTGRIVERKGVDMVLKSLQKVITQVPDALLVVTGRGEYEEKLKEIVRQENLENYVNFIGFVSNDDLPYLYNMSDVYIMASRQLENQDVEGFGIVFLDANLFSKPVIGGNSGGIPSAVEHNVSGILVDPESTDEISKTLIKLLTNQELSNRLGSQGMHRALSEFQWPVQAKKIIDVLE